MVGGEGGKKVGSCPKNILGDLSNFPSCLERIKPSPSCMQHPLHKCKHFLRVKVIDFPGLCINQYLKMPGKDRETQLLQVLWISASPGGPSQRNGSPVLFVRLDRFLHEQLITAQSPGAGEQRTGVPPQGGPRSPLGCH